MNVTMCVCSAVEPPRPLPRVCPCENGGTCEEDGAGGVRCACGAAGAGPTCARAPAAAAARAATAAAVLVPLLLVLLLALAGAAAWFVIRKRPL